MEVLGALLSDPAMLVLASGLLGLVVGSFLNVVIHRLPVMMERAWRSECEEFLGLAHGEPADAPPYNLVVPRSRCTNCGHAISALENIPVISYVLLRGRCAACKAPISPRYPLIEAFTALLSALVAWRFGAAWQTPAALVLTWALICLAAVDLEKMLLPDAITLPFIWLGLLLSVPGWFTDSPASIIGAIAGYLALWSVYQLFRLLTGKEGMGHGDFKLLALFGAWMGWPLLLPVILLSSLVGALVGTGLIVFCRHERSRPIPFGPYLCAAGWITLLWGQQMVSWYFQTAGLRP